MNWVDFFIGVVLILAIVIGYKRGLFKEVSTFLGLVIGAVVAFNYAGWLALHTEGLVNISASLRYVFAFVICFAACLLIFKLIGYYFYKMVKLSKMGVTDRMGGAIFGAMKGIVVLSLIFLMFIFLPVFQSFNHSIDESTMAPWVRQFIPEAFDLTDHFHPQSGKFVDKVSEGVLGSQASAYAKNRGSLLDDNNPSGFSLEDMRVLDNIDKYFGSEVAVATKGDEKSKE